MATLRAEKNSKGHKLINFDLQSFGESTAGNDAAKAEEQLHDNSATSGADHDTDGDEERTYTEEELQKKLQSESDRRVTEALKTARADFEKTLDEKIKAAREEEKELAKLSAEERAQKEFEQEKKALEDDRRALDKEKLEIQTAKKLREEGLDPNFAAFLMQENDELTTDNIQTFKEAFNDAVDLAVKEKLKGTTPEAKGNSGSNALSLEDEINKIMGL